MPIDAVTFTGLSIPELHKLSSPLLGSPRCLSLSGCSLSIAHVQQWGCAYHNAQQLHLRPLKSPAGDVCLLGGVWDQGSVLLTLIPYAEHWGWRNNHGVYVKHSKGLLHARWWRAGVRRHGTPVHCYPALVPQHSCSAPCSAELCNYRIIKSSRLDKTSKSILSNL